jgi:hypothetical protein
MAGLRVRPSGSAEDVAVGSQPYNLQAWTVVMAHESPRRGRSAGTRGGASCIQKKKRQLV